MVAFLRHFLIVLAVLLQSAAPLVHAHIGGEASIPGLHLHEFETLHPAAHKATLGKVGQSVDAESCIVDLGSAIKDHKAPADSAPALYAFDNAPAIDGNRKVNTVNFSPHQASFVPSPLLANNVARAPPRLEAGR